MRVLIVNTSERTGGAAIAANRLMHALCAAGIDARMLVRDKSTADPRVSTIGNGWRRRWHFLWERWCIFVRMHFSKKHLFEVDIANAGTDITGTKEFREADVIHLHWINQGMLSLKDIRKIVESGKPVVWTMHDFWPATGICHYPHECEAYATGCGCCPYLPGGGSRCDLSARVWRRKDKAWHLAPLTFVACSRWLAGKAARSGLLAGCEVVSVPNTIDTTVYHPAPADEARRRLSLPEGKRLILFVSQRITDKRKGMDYFIEACRLLAEGNPSLAADTAVVILGGHSQEFAGRLALPVYPLGYVSDTSKIIDVYNAVDTFVLPSLEDNLPNTVMEAMACGVPCVGFDTGGVPEMIDHLENGYVARYRDAADLAAGIAWVLVNDGIAALGRNAVDKVAREYSQPSVAAKYIAVYERALSVSRARSGNPPRDC